MKRKLTTLLTLAVAMLAILCFCTSCNLFIKFDVKFIVDGKTYATVNLKHTEKITMPKDPTKKGFEFDGWYLDENIWVKPFTANTLLDMPLTDKMNLNVYAKWISAETASYKVEYYLQNIENDNYPSIPFVTVEKTGTVNETVSAEIRTFEHFTPTAEKVDGKITADNSLTLKVYYTRNKYNVTFNPNGGTLESGFLTQQVKYGGNAIAPIFSRTGYSIGYDKSFENISSDTIINVSWQINQYTLTIDFANGEEKVITQNYGTTIENFENPKRQGYAFICYTEDIPETMPAKDLTIKAVWQSLFLHKNGVITGLNSYGQNESEIVIPEIIDGIPITKIGDFAFSSFSSITKITIPTTITHIGYAAFYECYGLETVIIGNNLFDIEKANTVIGECAFLACHQLKNITLGNNVKSIGNRAFSSPVLENIIIPNSVVSIGYGAFSCESLISIVIPKSVTYIGENIIDCETSALQSIYYGGTEKDWTKITIETSNSDLLKATRYYYVENEEDLPADNGNYWHYVDGVPTAWVKTEE